MKKFLVVIGIVCIVVGFALAIYNGVISATGTKIVESVWGTKTTENTFNFGIFLIHFLKWNAIGLFGSAICFHFSTEH